MSMRDSERGKGHGHRGDPTRASRRTFLKSVVAATPALGLLGCGPRHGSAQARTPVYFTPDEAAFIDAATQRLIPADDLGGGANEAGITAFIDLQLAGAYGRAQRWYMQGPWPRGIDQQGFQLKYTPAQIYRDAIGRVEAHCRQQYGKPFAQLDPAHQDDLLHALEKGEVDLGDIPAKTFFAMLWQNTQEGYLADPAYSGNRDFAGWKLIGFPGPRYNYVEDIGKFGRPYEAPFVSLVGRDPSAYLRGES